MKKGKTYHTDDYTKGGQVFAHMWRMRLQNLRIVVLGSLIFFVLGVYLALRLRSVSYSDFVDFYIFTYVPAKTKVLLWPYCQTAGKFIESFINAFTPWKLHFGFLKIKVSSFKTIYFDTQGRSLGFRTIDFLSNSWVQAKAARVYWIFKTGFYGWCVGLFAIGYYFKRKSIALEERKVLDGSPLCSLKQAIRLIKKDGASKLKIAPKLPLFKSAESSHIMVVGATGSGKTNCINGFLEQVRSQKKRALILDTNGTYVKRFYNPARGDIILNPYDERSCIWDLWLDAKTPEDFDIFAQSLIPEPKGAVNPVWHKNAREIISCTAEKLKHDPERSFQKLVDYAGWKPIREVKGFYLGTPVEGLMCASGRAEETVHSVRMQMTDALKSLARLPDPINNGFSIRDWVKNPKNKGWLFISTDVSKRASLTPLLKFWVSLAMQAALERKPYNKDLIPFALDEIFSLEGGTVANLPTFLQEARKYEVCAILGLQDLAGLQAIYGYELFRSIFTNCLTKAFFTTKDPQSAQFISSSMGQIEVIESTESLSMGSHHMRDGVNMNTQRRLKPKVSTDDLMALPNLEAFISMPQNIVTKTKYPYYRERKI